MTLSTTDIVVIVLCTVIGAFLIAGVCIIVYLKHVRVSVRPTGQRGQFGIFVCMLLYSPSLALFLDWLDAISAYC